jgi:DNA-binding HxlR family transcriptional regulator
MSYERKLPKRLDCGMAVIMEIIGGKWKPSVIHSIHHGFRRPSEIQRRYPDATRRVLNQQLKELELHGIVRHVVYPVMPPKVEYFLTDLGESLLPVIQKMDEWGTGYLGTYNELLYKTEDNFLSAIP